MAAEGCEEMSGNGELEESPGSLINVNEFIIRGFVSFCTHYWPVVLCEDTVNEGYADLF